MIAMVILKRDPEMEPSSLTVLPLLRQTHIVTLVLPILIVIVEKGVLPKESAVKTLIYRWCFAGVKEMHLPVIKWDTKEMLHPSLKKD